MRVACGRLTGGTTLMETRCHGREHCRARAGSSGLPFVGGLRVGHVLAGHQEPERSDPNHRATIPERSAQLLYSHFGSLYKKYKSRQPNMTTATSPILLKWDPKSLEIRTVTVERLLEPLVTQVTTLVNTSSKGPSSKKKGRSKKAHVLAASVEQATQNFLEKGDQIAKESQDLKEELLVAVDDVRKQGMYF
ncbi:hypothetical protein chiPu_0009581 [Chiloscyllium punctatum]|uniref:Catenin alpha-2 n=1 Tax=Chiloscyllium punctatum TaxID=137246 RepID=A0A401SL46_CHIPU|nr:hypothetical protein [Chiloscyllium punctatum]